MNISEDLAFNIILDWKKRNITLEEKSEFLKNLLQEKKISQRELARQLEISHSTIQDWISMRQINKIHKLQDNDIDRLLDRLYFLLSKPFKPTSKTFERIKRLKSELEKLELEVV